MAAKAVDFSEKGTYNNTISLWSFSKTHVN